MTAVNTINQGDRVTLIADAAMFDLDWMVASVEAKLCIDRRARTAWASRGGCGYSYRLSARLCGRPGLDETLVRIADDLRAIAVVERFLSRHAPPLYHGCDVSLIGWSDKRDRPEAWKISIGDESPSFVPLMSIGPYPFTDVVNAFDFAAGRPIADEADWSTVNTFAAARRVIDAQRHHRVTDAFTAAEIIVGGFAEMVTIDRERIRRRRLRTWRDTIGEKITPGK